MSISARFPYRQMLTARFIEVHSTANWKKVIVLYSNTNEKREQICRQYRFSRTDSPRTPATDRWLKCVTLCIRYALDHSSAEKPQHIVLAIMEQLKGYLIITRWVQWFSQLNVGWLATPHKTLMLLQRVIINAPLEFYLRNTTSRGAMSELSLPTNLPVMWL